MAQVRIHADYDEKGIPSILSVSTRDLEKALREPTPDNGSYRRRRSRA